MGASRQCRPSHPLASKPLSTERSSQALTDPAATTEPTDRSSLPRTTSKPKREYLVKGTKFEVDSRYEVKKGIGQGAYGLVCRAQDTQSGDRVAIKKISNIEDAIDSCIRLLQHFQHENILSLRDLMLPLDARATEGVYLVTECFDSDLHQIIHSKQPLSDDHAQFFMYQLLRGLKALHSAKVVHRDLKPGNLLVNKNCDLKICDFGMARGIDDRSRALTDYVCTRWWRAPELLVENEKYGPEVDRPAARATLLPGRDYLDQLKLIDAHRLRSGFGREPTCRPLHQGAAAARRLPPNALPEGERGGDHILERMLVFDPRERVTAADALADPYFGALHDDNDEPDAAPFDFSFEDTRDGMPLDEKALRKEIWASSPERR